MIKKSNDMTNKNVRTLFMGGGPPLVSAAPGRWGEWEDSEVAATSEPALSLTAATATAAGDLLLFTSLFTLFRGGLDWSAVASSTAAGGTGPGFGTVARAYVLDFVMVICEIIKYID